MVSGPTSDKPTPTNLTFIYKSLKFTQSLLERHARILTRRAKDIDRFDATERGGDLLCTGTHTSMVVGRGKSRGVSAPLDENFNLGSILRVLLEVSAH